MLEEEVMFLVVSMCVHPFALKITGSRSKMLGEFSTTSTHGRCDTLAFSLAYAILQIINIQGKAE